MLLSREGREGLLRMWLLGKRQDKVAGMQGAGIGHLDQNHEGMLGKTHQEPLEQVGFDMAGPLIQDGLQVEQDRQLAGGKDNQVVDLGKLLADLGTQLAVQDKLHIDQHFLDVPLPVVLLGQVDFDVHHLAIQVDQIDLDVLVHYSLLLLLDLHAY